MRRRPSGRAARIALALGPSANPPLSRGNADPARARDQLAALVAARQRDLGPDHPDALEARLQLAASTGLAGDRAAARDQLAALRPDMERALGADHLYTLVGRCWLALLTGAAGDAAAARASARATSGGTRRWRTSTTCASSRSPSLSSTRPAG